jgi:pyruvate-formate lyase-activating enzyme
MVSAAPAFNINHFYRMPAYDDFTERPGLSNPPSLIVADDHGRIFDMPGLIMAGMSIARPQVPDSAHLCVIPEHASLFKLSGRRPIGYDPAAKRFVTVHEFHGMPVHAVGAFASPAYILFLHTAFKALSDAPRLPLYSYAAVGWKDGRFYAAARKIDRDFHTPVDERDVCRRARLLKRRYTGNRLVRHLMDNCVLRYQCPNARNLALGRWECPVPASPGCNARCIGCISLQPESSHVPASQHRFDFVPTRGEIVEYAAPHLQHACRAVASFGQGCEGEPLLQARVIEAAIREIRRRTSRGIIHMNTNAGMPRAVGRLCRAGLDSIRVSMNSAQPRYYAAYHRPRGYSFDDVLASMRIVRGHGAWVSINYLAFPGFTDHPEEMAAFFRLVRTARPDMVQLRNLNIDPEWYIRELGLERLRGKPRGMPAWIDEMRRRFPGIRLGYYNPPRSEISRWRREHPRGRP